MTTPEFPTTHLPKNDITDLSPEQIVERLRTHRNTSGIEITIPHPGYYLRKLLQNFTPPSPAEAIRAIRKVTASGGFIL